MSRLQEVFERTLETKKEIKEIKSMYKDALSNSQRYCDIDEELKDIKAKKKEIEDSIRDDFEKDFERLELLSADLKNDNMLLSDISISCVAKGQKIEVKDPHEIIQEPVFNVKFTKKS